MTEAELDERLSLEYKVRELQGECEELRAMADFLERGMQVKPADLVEMVSEIARMRAAFKDLVEHLRDGSTFSMSCCEWCGELWPKCDGQSREVTEQAARYHLYRCEKHPLRIECEHLRAERDALKYRLEGLER